MNYNNYKSHFASAATIVAIGFSLAFSSSAEAQITVMPPHSTVAGKTIGEWTQNWWSWALSQAEPNGPLTDATGANANINQSGPVFFLGGTTGLAADRTFTIPTGKFVLLPLTNIVGTDADVPGGTPDDLKALVQSLFSSSDPLSASLDGVSLDPADLALTREDSGSFPLDVAPGSVFDFPGGVPSGHHPFAFSDGYWLMLNPLSPGSHDIEFGGGLSAFGISVDVNDHITPVPEPGSLAILSGLTLFGGNTLRRLRKQRK